ncbi:MAG: tail fiber protein [Bacteroidota bacterium]
MEPFIGQITMFGGNFAPRGWALCDGQLLAISSHSALFSLLGTTYGGDGRTTFALPDLRGRAGMHAGHGPGLSNRTLGAKTGTETNTLNQNQLPPHSHTAVVGGNISIGVSSSIGDEGNPDGNVLAESPANVYSGNGASPGQALDGVSNGVTVNVLNNGGSQPINNMQPVQVVNYIIALQGIFPSRS